MDIPVIVIQLWTGNCCYCHQEMYMWQPHALAVTSWTSKLVKLILSCFPPMDLHVRSSLPSTVVPSTLSKPAPKIVYYHGNCKYWLVITYRIALNFWRLNFHKFSQTVIFEDSVETISWIPCMLWAWYTSQIDLTCTFTLLSAWAHSCQQSNAYFKGISLERLPCGFSSLAPGMLIVLCCSCSENHVVCQKFLLKYFCKQLKFAKLKTFKNFALYST